MKLEYVLPADIEKRSFEIIESELEAEIPERIKPVVIRAIHTTADFDYAESLYFSEGIIEKALETLDSGAVIVTDTNMAKAGINKAALARHGCECMCFMADADVAETAKLNGTTRATASVDKAALLGRPVIYAVGNAPTALVRLDELVKDEDVDMILCAAGGDFMLEMMPYVNFDHIRENPKWICGMSDPTNLLFTVTRTEFCGGPHFHIFLC